MEPPSPTSSPSTSIASSSAKSVPSSQPSSPISSPGKSVVSSGPEEVFSSPTSYIYPSSRQEDHKRRKIDPELGHSSSACGDQHRQILFGDASVQHSDSEFHEESHFNVHMEDVDRNVTQHSVTKFRHGSHSNIPMDDEAGNPVVISDVVTFERSYKVLCDSDSSSDESDDLETSAASSASSPLSSSGDQMNEVSSSCDEESEFSEREESIGNGSDDESTVHYSSKIYEGCDLTEDEGVLMLMDLFQKYKLSKKVTGDVLKGIHKLLPGDNTLPRTQYGLFQYVQKLCPLPEEKVHYYCSVCLFYLGATDIACNVCSATESHKFYQLSLADQIRNLFENHDLADLIDKYLESRNNSSMDRGYSDLLDGSEFKRAIVVGQYNLVLMGHTDGISLSKSSNVSLWPLEWVMAQLPFHLRSKFILISGIWVDECKPYMNTFLKPFAEELKDLGERGIQWCHPRTKETHTTIISVCSFCADAPVRAQLQNILSHGGRHCCSICEQKMKKLPPEPVRPGVKKKRRRRVFTFDEAPPELRTSERMLEQGNEARRNATGSKVTAVKGVKGPSVISDIPGCDRSTVVFPEYMHLILCLVKDFMTLWFDSQGPWNLKDHQNDINQFLTNIKVPDYITRIPRSTELCSKWKANELRSFLLFFSVIILSRCMKDEYFQHWLLLVCSFDMLLQDFVSQNNVDRANILLRLFCRDFAALYLPDKYTYYIHNLSHLAVTVERHGPLHSNSAFMFESYNGTLAKYIHGSKNQSKELVNNIRIGMGVELLRARSLRNPAVEHKQSIVTFKNKVKDFDLTEEEVQLLMASNKYQEPIDMYFRAKIKHEILTSYLYTRQKRRNNYTICYLNSSHIKAFGEVKCFLKSTTNEMALVRKFQVDHLRTFCHTASQTILKHIVPISPTVTIEVIDLSAILFKVIRVEDFVCLRPNSHEYNL